MMERLTSATTTWPATMPGRKTASGVSRQFYRECTWTSGPESREWTKGTDALRYDFAADLFPQGREYDPETNLYYYRARYYDPTMGRFLQTDPIGYEDSMNLYQAMNQNVVNYLDPLGLIKFKFDYLGVIKDIATGNNPIMLDKPELLKRGLNDYIPQTNRSQAVVDKYRSNITISINKDSITGLWHAEFNINVTAFIYLFRNKSSPKNLKHEEEHILTYKLLFLETLFKLRKAEDIGYKSEILCKNAAEKIKNESGMKTMSKTSDWYPNDKWYDFFENIAQFWSSDLPAHLRRTKNTAAKIDENLLDFDLASFERVYRKYKKFNYNRYIKEKN